MTNSTGLYGNVREMKTRCQNMNSLPPVLRKYCQNAGLTPKTSVLRKPNGGNILKFKNKWQTAGTYSKMYNNYQKGNSMKWAINSSMYKNKIKSNNQKAKTNMMKQQKPTNLRVRTTSQNRAKTLKNANALLRNLQGPKPKMSEENKMNRMMRNLNKMAENRKHAQQRAASAQRRAQTLRNANSLLRNLNPPKKQSTNQKLNSMVKELNQMAMKRETSRAAAQNTRTMINSRTDPISKVKNKLLQLERNGIKVRQSIMSSYNRKEILDGTINPQRASILFKKLSNL